MSRHYSDLYPALRKECWIYIIVDLCLRYPNGIDKVIHRTKLALTYPWIKGHEINDMLTHTFMSKDLTTRLTISIHGHRTQFERTRFYLRRLTLGMRFYN